MTDEILDPTTELKPKRRNRGKVSEPVVSPLREEPPSYPEVGEAPLADIDNPTALKIAEMWANEVADFEKPKIEQIIAGATKRVPEQPKGLHMKLAEVMLAAGRIPKRGKAPAAMGGFDFVQVGDAADVIRRELGIRGVTMLPETVEVVDDGLAGTVFIQSKTRGGGDMTTFTIKTTWRLTDADTGQTTTIQSLGTGADTHDKFSPKAQTNAMKYAFLMGFLLSTGDDPEAFDLINEVSDPIIGDSNVPGVAQGGRQSKITAPQLDTIRRLVSQKQLDANALMATISESDMLTTELEAQVDGYFTTLEPGVPESDKRKLAMEIIGGFSFAQAGKLIRELES